MNVSDGKIYYDEPLQTIANILEAIIDIILYGSMVLKQKNYLFCYNPFAFRNDNYEFISLGITTSKFPLISEKFIW